MGKFLVLAGGIVAGAGFITGVAGLTVLGMTDSESDIVRKKIEIDREKLKIQGKIIEEEEKIKSLEKKIQDVKNKIADLEATKTKRQENNKKFKEHFLKKIGELDINQEECKEIKLQDFVKSGDNDAWKDEEWFKKISKEFTGSTKFGKNCKEEIN